MNDQEFLQQAVAYLENRLSAQQEFFFLEALNKNDARKKLFFQLKDVYDLLKESPEPDVEELWKQSVQKWSTLSGHRKTHGQQE